MAFNNIPPFRVRKLETIGEIGWKIGKNKENKGGIGKIRIKWEEEKKSGKKKKKKKKKKHFKSGSKKKSGKNQEKNK